MFNDSNIKIEKIKGWFNGEGAEDDVVLSSRVRLARNLANFPFPNMMNENEERAVEERIVGAFEKIKDDEGFTVIRLAKLSPIDRRILLERNYITQDFLLAKNKTLILNESETFSAMINEEDHLRLASLHSGLSLKESFEEVDRIDSELENYLHYSVSLEWGYLNSSLNNIGTAMRGSVMLHLPALVMTSLIDRVLKSVNEVGLSVKGFFGEDEGSLGDMYQLSNQITLGLSEEEIIEKLEGIAIQLVNYERKARRELLEKRRVDVVDKVMRALGILKYCRILTVKEAVELLTLLRLGVSMGLVRGVDFATINTLLFIVQKSNIQKMVNEIYGKDFDNHQINYIRAKIIRETLEATENLEGKDV